MFVSSTTMLCLYVLFFCCINIKKIMHAYQCNVWRALWRSPVSGILILYTFVTVWFVGGLTSFHLYLILTNQVLILTFLLYVIILIFPHPKLNIFIKRRQHMRISGIGTTERQILITVGVSKMLWRLYVQKFLVLRIASGKKSQ